MAIKNRFYTEPFFHFVVIGAIIFLLNAVFNQEDSSENQIVITKDDVARISKLYEQNWNQPPDEETLEKLIENFVHSEIYYQEALKLNLDHNDEIIKRRLRQKYEFVAQDLADIVEPSEEELRAFYNDHQDLFQTPKKISFFQFYINPDKHKDPLRAAHDLLNKLSNRDVSQLKKEGDQSHINRYHVDQDQVSLRRTFGADFSDQLIIIEREGWTGPVKSGYGFHVLFIEKIQSAQVLSFQDATEDVLSKWKEANRTDFTDRLILSLKDNYKIIRRDL